MGKTLFWILALGLQIYKFYQYRKIMIYYQNILKRIKDLEVISVSELTNKLGKQLSKVGEYVLCRGTLKASEPFKSRLDSRTLVVYSELVMEKIFEIGQRSSRIQKLLGKIRPSFLILSDFHKTIKIYETTFTQMITSKRRKIKFKISEKLPNFNWLISIFAKFPIRSKPISLIYKQDIIQQNTANVVFGKTSKNQNGEIYFEKPKAIGASKRQILDRYFGDMNYYKIGSYFMLVLGIITMILFYKWELKEKIADLFKKQYTNIIDKYKKIIVKQRKCSRCQQKLSSVIWHPCGHLNYCSDCASLIRKCYDCRRKPQQEIHIYPS